MFNDVLSAYEKLISIKQILKINKINMNLLNWMTWSSETCKKLKRLCIKIIKKRASKIKKQSFSQYSSFFESFNSEIFTKFTLFSLNTMISKMKNSTFQSNDSFMIYFLLDQYKQLYQTSSQTIQNWQREITQLSQSAQSSQQFSIMSKTLSFSSFSQSRQSQIHSSIQFETQSEVQSQSSVIQFMMNAENVLNVKVEESNIKFLRNLKSMKRAFKIKCTIIRSFEEFTKLKKFTMQVDQESDMNIMTNSLRNQLKLFKNKLTNIKFHELFMKTTNDRDIYLKFWTKCSIAVKEIMRMIKCFIFFTISIVESSISNHHNLLLRLSWLFNVNAVLTIREFKITIEDSAIKKTSKDVMKSKMIFCREHILLMYSRKIFEKPEKLSEFEFESFDDFFENELFDIKNISIKYVFERF